MRITSNTDLPAAVLYTSWVQLRKSTNIYLRMFAIRSCITELCTYIPSHPFLNIALHCITNVCSGKHIDEWQRTPAVLCIFTNTSENAANIDTNNSENATTLQFITITFFQSSNQSIKKTDWRVVTLQVSSKVTQCFVQRLTYVHKTISRASNLKRFTIISINFGCYNIARNYHKLTSLLPGNTWGFVVSLVCKAGRTHLSLLPFNGDRFQTTATTSTVSLISNLVCVQ